MQLLHTMFRVANLEKSIDFYTTVLGMKLMSQKDFPQGRFSLAFLAYGEKGEQAALELTHNWDTDAYELGTAFGHIAIKVDDVYKACEVMRKAGGNVVREPGPMGENGPVLAFLKDPDGYMVELLEVDPLQVEW